MSIIIPAIDLIDGKCVRLTEGEFDTSVVYHDSPLEMAKIFEGHGATRLHLVDLDGARIGKLKHLSVLEKIAGATTLKVDFSGGIRKREDIDSALAAGASQVSVGSMAVQDTELFCDCVDYVGAEKIILSADVRDEKLALKGWSDQSEINLFDFIRSIGKKVDLQFVACTDISLDGRMSGPSLNLYQRLKEAFPKINLIASGGVATVQDLERLGAIGVFGAIVGRALYEGKITLKNLASSDLNLNTDKGVD